MYLSSLWKEYVFQSYYINMWSLGENHWIHVLFIFLPDLKIRSNFEVRFGFSDLKNHTNDTWEILSGAESFLIHFWTIYSAKFEKRVVAKKLNFLFTFSNKCLCYRSFGLQISKKVLCFGKQLNKRRKW